MSRLPIRTTNTAGANRSRVVIVCDICDRRGEYSATRFAEIVGPETTMPDALRKFCEIQGCERVREQSDRVHDRCQARYEI